MAVDLQEDSAPLWTGDASDLQQGGTDVSNRLQKRNLAFSLDDYEGKSHQKGTERVSVTLAKTFFSP